MLWGQQNRAVTVFFTLDFVSSCSNFSHEFNFFLFIVLFHVEISVFYLVFFLYQYSFRRTTDDYTSVVAATLLVMVVSAGKKSGSAEGGHALEFERNFHVFIMLLIIFNYISDKYCDALLQKLILDSKTFKTTLSI